MKIKLKQILLTGILGCTLSTLTSSASAQVKEHFQLLDENGDGQLTARELVLLEPLSAQHSGRVDLAAFTSAVRTREIAHRAQWLTILGQRDGNKDGWLSGNEFSGYEFADLNKDGRIDEREYMQGVHEFFGAMSTLSPKAVSEKALERFRMMDINVDGRLSGSEAASMVASDMSGDGRITQQEYVAAAILDVIAAVDSLPVDPIAPVDPVAPMAPSAPPAPSLPISNNAFDALVQAINNQDSQAFMALCRPEFQKLVNVNVLTHILAQIKQGNGRLSSTNNVEVSPGPQPGTQAMVAEVPVERGSIAISLVVLQDKILGVGMNGSAVDQAIPKLLESMMADIDGKLTPFARELSPECMRMIRRIQAGEDDVAISMFHPEVQQQVGSATFAKLFDAMRAKVGKYQKIELEAAGVEMNAAGTSGFINLTHRVEGTQGVALVKHSLQIVGFKPHIVVIAVEPDA